LHSMNSNFAAHDKVQILEPTERGCLLHQSGAQLIPVVNSWKPESDFYPGAIAIHSHRMYRPSLAQRLPEPGINVGFEALFECRISVIRHRVRGSRPVGLEGDANCSGSGEWRVKALWHNEPPAASPGIA
jgi:hypothetical protein